MSKVITLRLKEKELNFIRALSDIEKEDRSYITRKLIRYGWVYVVLKDYKEGKISLGKAAKSLDTNITGMIELLADLGIKSPIEYEEYLEGYNSLKEVL